MAQRLWHLGKSQRVYIDGLMDSGPLVRRSAIPKVHYSEACVPKLLYKLAEACYISVTGTNPNPKP